MTRPFQSYPTGGTESFDRLSDRLSIELLSFPTQLNVGEALALRFRFLFDNKPLNTLGDWPTEDDCEDLESHLIPRNHFVAEVGFSGPQPRDTFNMAGAAFAENAQVYSRDFDTRSYKPGTYKFVIVAVGHLQIGGRASVVARRLEVTLRLLGQVAQNASFWTIEYVNKAWGSHGMTRFTRIEAGAVQAQVNNMVMPLMLRAPSGLLLYERLFDFDESTNDIVTIHVPVNASNGRALRKITANGEVMTIPPIAGVDPNRIITLAVDGTRRRLWLALNTGLMAVSLDTYDLISNRPNVIATSIAIDPFSGELWASAHLKSGPGPTSYGLKRYGLEGNPSIDLNTVTSVRSNHHAGMVPLNDGSLVMLGIQNRESKYIRITSDGNIHSSSQAIGEAIVQFGVNPENGEVWEIVMAMGRITTLQHRMADFSVRQRLGPTNFGFANVFGVDYIPALGSAVVIGNSRFNLKPHFRGQLAQISGQGVIKEISFTGTAVGIVKSVR